MVGVSIGKLIFPRSAWEWLEVVQSPPAGWRLSRAALGDLREPDDLWRATRRDGIRENKGERDRRKKKEKERVKTSDDA